MIRSRLYLQVYFAVIGSLALVAVILSLLALLGKFDSHGPFSDRMDRFANALLVENIDAARRQDMLDRLSRGLDADIALFDRDGRFLQGSGDFIAGPDREPDNNVRPHYRAFDARLPDGGEVVAYLRRPFAPPRRNLIFIFLAVAGAAAVAAYPVVRHLTRRLETLRRTVENWGSGELAARATVSGKDEVAMVAGAFNQAADRVEALVNSQKSLLANASHELRSPLARLRMAIEMYEITQGEELKKEIIKNMSELDELVDEILLKSRLGSAQPVEMDQVVDLLALAAEEGAQAEAEIDGEHIVALGNEKLLRRMIRNLIQNAVRHGRSPVQVFLSSHNGMITISVRDHGDGLARDEAGRIFEPFYRPAGRSETQGGWGLGLALVAEIARLHGGRAYYSQPDDGGACFCVEIADRRS
jgi:signal transduction histidine kinase